MLRQELEISRKEKDMAEGQESKLMEELGKLRQAMTSEEEKDRKFALDLLADKKRLLQETEELRLQLSARSASQRELQQRCEQMKEQRRALEEQIAQIKMDLASLGKVNREAMQKQRDGFEQRIREMEEEVTKVSLQRYKNELDSKQRYLKTAQKYEEQIRDLRASMAIVVHLLELDAGDVPEFLKSSSTTTPRQLRSILEDNQDLHNLITIIEKKIAAMSKRGQRGTSQGSANQDDHHYHS